MNFGIITLFGLPESPFCSDLGFIMPSISLSLMEKIDPSSCPCKSTLAGLSDNFPGSLPTCPAM